MGSKPQVGTKKGTISPVPGPSLGSEAALNLALAKAVQRENPQAEDSSQPIFSFMNRVPVKIKADDADFVPKYKSRGAACCDLVANIKEPDSIGNYVLTINPGMTVVVDCGFTMQLVPGYEAQVRSRSGLASRGLIVTNGIGTIDDDYRGRVTVILTNVGKEIIQIKHKERIAQMALKPVWYFVWQETDQLDLTERGSGGFGSTGEK